MAKSTGKKSTPVKRKKALKRVDIFEIERNPPPFTSRWNPERAAILAKVDETLKTVNIGEAFIVPAKYRHTVSKYVTENYPADKFSFQAIHDNPDAVRVYRLAYPKK
jgi:hypothetical protein